MQTRAISTSVSVERILAGANSASPSSLFPTKNSKIGPLLGHANGTGHSHLSPTGPREHTMAFMSVQPCLGHWISVVTATTGLVIWLNGPDCQVTHRGRTVSDPRVSHAGGDKDDVAWTRFHRFAAKAVLRRTFQQVIGLLRDVLMLVRRVQCGVRNLSQMNVKLLCLVPETE